MDNQELINKLLALSSSIKIREKSDRPSISLPAENLYPIMETLRNRPELSFDMLVCFTAVDWPKENNFELVYQLHSTQHHHYLMVGVYVNRNNPFVPSVSALWEIAEWQEREIFDLFGVRFSNHPDLRRLLLEDDWNGHPLCKDYVDDFMLERPWR